MFLAQVRDLAIESGNTELQLALLKYDAPLSRKPSTTRKGARRVAHTLARLSEKK